MAYRSKPLESLKAIFAIDSFALQQRYIDVFTTRSFDEFPIGEAAENVSGSYRIFGQKKGGLIGGQDHGWQKNRGRKMKRKQDNAQPRWAALIPTTHVHG
jgi:hypothetical protein